MMRTPFFIIFILLFCNLIEARPSQDPEAKREMEMLTHYLSDLVAIKSVTSDKAANKKALEYVQTQLHSLSLHVEEYNFEGHPSIVITTQKTRAPKVLLLAHIDVVPGPDNLFQPVFRDNKMFGRGVYDMKMAIASYILLLRDLRERLPELDIGVMITSDEEIGGMNGTKKLLEEGYTARIALLPDGGFDWNFEESAKGIIQMKIQAQGKSAHGSRPWLGDNAINKLTDALQEIRFYFDELKPQFGDYYPTVNVGAIEGGAAANQVADHAEAKLDIRYPPGASKEEILAKIEQIAVKHGGLKVEITLAANPHKQNVEDPYFLLFKKIAKSMHGIEMGTLLAHGASDARFFGERGLPVMVVAPKGGEIHSDHEWVDLEDLQRFYSTLKAWILEIHNEK